MNSIDLLRGEISYSIHSNNQDHAVRKNTHYYYPQIVRNGLKFILDHFHEPIFPRTVSTYATNGGQRKVCNLSQVMEIFRKSNYLDCRINAFPATEKPLPSFLFMDIDSVHQKISLNEILQTTISNIKKRLDGSPTILWTGNGYHIYQPIYSPMQLREVKEFDRFENVDNKFLRFEKDYLSNGSADKSNYPALGSCMLRIPGSLNSKCILKGMKEIDSRVKILKSWDSVRPHIRNQLGTFYSYLVSEEIESPKNTELNNRNWKYPIHSEIKWIERLLRVSLEDYRKFCLWRILIPYLVNIKRIPLTEVYAILEEWLIGCNAKRKLDFVPKVVIRSYIKNVNEFKPISLLKLKKENPQLIIIVDRNV